VYSGKRAYQIVIQVRNKVSSAPPIYEKTGSLKPVFLCLNPATPGDSDWFKRTEAFPSRHVPALTLSQADILCDCPLEAYPSSEVDPDF